jgi:DNA modification methylase
MIVLNEQGTPQLNTVHNCKALNLLGNMVSKSVDCIITDPPYGINKAEWDASFPTDWISEAWRVTDRMIVMCGSDDIIRVAGAIGQYTGCVILHARNGMTRTHIGFRNWTPALLFGDWKWKPVPDYIPFNVSITEKINHPSPKPMQAMLKLIEYYSDPGWLVVDPFGGSGTTAIAARGLGRKWLTCDTSREYCDLMERRLAMPYTQRMALPA